MIRRNYFIYTTNILLFVILTICTLEFDLTVGLSQIPQDDRPLYLGVTPGQKYLKDKGRQSNQMGLLKITWVGFQQLGERGKVFVQTSAPPVYKVVASAADRLIIDFPAARLHTKNDARSIDTGFFPTVVRRVKATQYNRDTVRLTIKLRRPSPYQLTQDARFLHILFAPPEEPIDVISEREKELDDAQREAILRERRKE